jgi:hypothetical protein
MLSGSVGLQFLSNAFLWRPNKMGLRDYPARGEEEPSYATLLKWDHPYCMRLRDHPAGSSVFCVRGPRLCIVYR